METSKTSRKYLARDKKAVADQVLANIILNAAAGKPQYLGSVDVTAQDWRIAHSVGTCRAEIAKDRGITGEEWDRELLESGNSVDVEGALGDYLTQTLLGKSAARMAPLVEWRAFGAIADIEVAEPALQVDVKTAGEARANAAINCKSHYKKTPDAYLVAKIARSDVVDLFIVKADPVALRWYRFDGKAPFWVVPLPKLEALPEFG